MDAFGTVRLDILVEAPLGRPLGAWQRIRHPEVDFFCESAYTRKGEIVRPLHMVDLIPES